MEMRKIFYFIWTLFICLAKAENSSGANRQFKMNPIIVFPPDDMNPNGNKTAFNTVPDINKNSRDSFKFTNETSETDAVLPHISNRNSDLLAPSFNARLFNMLSSSAQHKNLVFSPISLLTLLAFIYTMSADQLQTELSHILELPTNRTYVAELFADIMENASSKQPTKTLIMANKLYYDYHFGSMDATVLNWAKNSFASEIEAMDFLNSKKSSHIINTWIQEKTRNLIQNIITPSTLTKDTQALLINSIYFKSEWLIKFDTEDTEVQTFYMNRNRQIPVDMMYNEDVFRYADLTEDLQATVVELPYNATNLTMLLLLPTDVEGLASLERKLNFYDFALMDKKLKREIVTVKLPKFKIEFETDMIETLQKLGLNALFNNEGSLNLFKNQQKPLKVDQFKHKAFINVNEAGTEAAAISVAKYIPLSIPVNMKYFTADHPFVFIIRDGHTILFMGHVAEF